ncbi:MAG: hypothetical protein N2689_08745 [Verrucomicrobiae bacterium]|nr:hypothetical protein [Verrucomicrobiae bacterium]
MRNKLLALILLMMARDAAADPAKPPAVIPYRFRQTTIVEALNTAHQVTRRDVRVEEVFPVEGRYLFHRLVRLNGRPLSPPEEAAEAQREAAFRDAARKGKKPKQPEVVTDLTTQFTDEELDRAFVSKEIGREQVRGRPCIVYEFRGRPGRRLKVGGQYQQFFEVVVDGILGRLWVDEEDRKPARGEVRLKHPASLMFGLLVYVKQFDLDVEFERLEPGVWWPREANGCVDARYLIFQTYIRRAHVQNEDFVRVGTSTDASGR